MALEIAEEVKSPYRTILGAFSRALARETHVLTKEPDLLWQRLYNRLQWEEDEVQQTLAPQLDERSVPGVKPWFRLNTRYRESEALVRILEEHTGEVNACAFSPDGHFVVSASSDDTLRVWDAATGQSLRTLEGHTGKVNACAFSPDGHFVVSASSDDTLRVWDTVTGESLRTLEGLNGDVKACAFSPDGCFIISGGWDEMLRVWDAATGQLLRTLEGHTGEVNACAFSPDGYFIVSASWDHTLRVWVTTTGQSLHTLKGPSFVYACAFSPDGCFIVSAGDNNTLRVWDAVTGESLRTLEGHTDTVKACAFSPDGRFIVSASEDRTLRVWDAVTGESRRTLKGHTNLVWKCAFSPDGRFIVSASWDKTLRVRNLDNGELLVRLLLPGAILLLGVHPWAPCIVCGEGKNVYIFEIVGVEYGPIIVTPWSTPSGRPIAFGCPCCRTWSEIPESALGSKIPCPNCAKPVRLNPFTIQGDWRKIAKAWKVGK